FVFLTETALDFSGLRHSFRFFSEPIAAPVSPPMPNLKPSIPYPSRRDDERHLVYTIEFQKRGLPHCHILLWLETEDKITTTRKIDEYISAEIPNKDKDPELHQLVTDHMMHGPCGADNPSCHYTIEYKCTKKFPRQFNETTVIDDSGYALYKRRNDGNIIKKSGTDLHNGYVVPYNPGLLRQYQAYINVEWCNQVGSIKYLFKYIYKGPDRVSATVDGKEVNEIKDFLNCRYLSACEAAWRIYGFEFHYRNPSIERLPFHLKDEQHVIFDATGSIDYAVDKNKEFGQGESKIGKANKGIKQLYEVERSLKQQFEDKEKRLTELNKFNAKLLKSLKVKEDKIEKLEADKEGLETEKVELQQQNLMLIQESAAKTKELEKSKCNTMIQGLTQISHELDKIRESVDSVQRTYINEQISMWMTKSRLYS
nr:hypothetical protein [Tanacetum cinerariifolium]